MQNDHFPENQNCDFWKVLTFLRKSDILLRNQHLKWKKVFKVLSFLRKCKKICTAISTCHFWSAENSSKNVRLGILKLVKPDICLKTDNINYVPLNPFFMFCWIEFWDMFFGVYLVPPRRPCLAAIMSNHHHYSPSALLHLQHHQINPQQLD